MSAAFQLPAEKAIHLKLEKLPPGPLPYNTNRRFVPRLRSPFSLKVVNKDIHLSGIDISFGGIMAASEKPIPPGTVLELQIVLPGESTTLAVRGRVVELISYRGKPAMRMRFDRPSQLLRQTIAGWMSRVSTQSPKTATLNHEGNSNR